MNRDTHTESDLWTTWLIEAKNGDKAAFAKLVEAAQEWVFVRAYRIMRDTQQAQDVVQDTFLRLWEKRSRFNPEKASARAWIAAIARNRATDVRRHLAHEHVGLPAKPGDDEGYAADVPDARAEDLSAAADRPQLRAHVQEALGNLRTKDRTALWLFHVEKAAYTQIAATLGCPLSAVGPRLTRARARLRRILKPTLTHA